MNGINKATFKDVSPPQKKIVQIFFFNATLKSPSKFRAEGQAVLSGKRKDTSEREER